MKNVSWLTILCAGLLLNAGAYRMQAWLIQEQEALKQDSVNLEVLDEQVSESLKEFQGLRQMKERDMEVFKASLGSLTKAKKALYESGLALQEEKRLLEKQLEIMTTSLRVDLEGKKVSLTREDHSLADFPIQFTSTQPFTDPLKKSQLRIISKERVAHPERGKLGVKDGVLTWNPPQVGQSVRSNALGEFVLFTNSSLIIHGPYKKEAEHAAYPHVCLGLSLSNARKLYRSSFIGNRVSLVR